MGYPPIKKMISWNFLEISKKFIVVSLGFRRGRKGRKEDPYIAGVPQRIPLGTGESCSHKKPLGVRLGVWDNL